MLNTCAICKATIDQNWSALQEQVKAKADLNKPLNAGFVERCIYCYKALLELTEKQEQQWYLIAIEAIAKRMKV